MSPSIPSPFDFAPLSWRARPLFDRPLCLSPEAAALLAGDPGALGAYAGGAPAPYHIEGDIAFIPIFGALVNRESFLTRALGITSYESIGSALRLAAADPLVRAIVLDINSPGGEAAGALETAELVRAIAETKPIIAFVNGVAASAGYWLASGASEIVVMPSAIVGSIGVVWLHLDYSAALANQGVKPTFMEAPEGGYKLDGNSYQFLDEGPRARIQVQLNDVYELFTASVGRHRPMLGQKGAMATKAAVVMGRRAVAAGLADRVAASPLPLAPRSALAPEARAAESPSRSTERPREAFGSVTVAAVNGDASIAEAYKAAAAAEAARIRDIIECAEAIDKPKLVRHLALETSLSVDHARARLAAAESEPQPGARMTRAPFLGARMRPIEGPALKPPPVTYRTMQAANAAIARGESFTLAISNPEGRA